MLITMHAYIHENHSYKRVLGYEPKEMMKPYV